MESAQHSAIVNFIWGIADDVLRDIYVRGKYRDVILPMTVIRRLDCLLEPTKPAVMALKERLDAAGVKDPWAALYSAADQKFCNTSPFTLRSLMAQPKQLLANFQEYLDGFSPNVREIIQKFDFRRHLKKLDDQDHLGDLVEKFIDRRINLSPEPVEGPGGVMIPGLSNHGMGSVFEELLRRFNEENNEEAGEHFTPREVIHLMTHLIIQPVQDDLESGTYRIYDCACGSGGMLTEAEEELLRLAKARGKQASVHLYGQEVQAETYAICKADLLIKGEDESHISFGSSLSADAFPLEHFDFMLANPPYGKSWKGDMARMGGKKDINDPRFVLDAFRGEEDYQMLPSSSDGQMLFMVDLLSKMKEDTVRGSRIATIHNGSSLFSGAPGGGESNIRRWVIDNDWLEAIIALPDQMFYNTGINTYIWLMTNRKAPERKGKVQLIDATSYFRKMRRSLGEKRKELSPEDIETIRALHRRFEEGEHVKIFDNDDFGFRRVTVERPLRLNFQVSEARIALLEEQTGWTNLVKSKKRNKEAAAKDIAEGEAQQVAIENVLWGLEEGRFYKSREAFVSDLKAAAKAAKVKLPAVVLKAILGALGERDETAEICRDKDGNPEPDTSLRDTEHIPLKEDVDDYLEREVRPFAPHAWVDESKTKIGYEVPFTRHFYTYTPPRPLVDIESEIRALEAELQGALGEMFA